jgi:hypothetical protein
MRGLVVALIASCSLAACTGSDRVSESSPSPETHTLKGTFDAKGDCIAEKRGVPDHD